MPSGAVVYAPDRVVDLPEASLVLAICAELLR
jgi:hypothetical protein